MYTFCCVTYVPGGKERYFVMEGEVFNVDEDDHDESFDLDDPETMASIICSLQEQTAYIVDDIFHVIDPEGNCVFQGWDDHAEAS